MRLLPLRGRLQLIQPIEVIAMYSRALRATTALCYLVFEYVLVLDAWSVRGGLLVCAWDIEGVRMEDRDKRVWV